MYPICKTREKILKGLVKARARYRIYLCGHTTKPFGEGTGMGLAITHGIVKSCGGGIQVYSEPGEGTTFHVYLPRIEESSYTQQSISTEPIRKGNESILLVDDEDQIVRMVQETLKGLGYHVTPRTSSIEALEAFRAQPDKFDLVITDMTMPNMTGVELAPQASGHQARYSHYPLHRIQ